MGRLLMALAMAICARGAEADWQGRFESHWRAKGKRQAIKTWLRSRRILVVHAGLSEADEVRDALREQLAALGSTSFVVESVKPPEPSPWAKCSKAGILDTKCLGRAIKLLRAEPPYTGSIIVLVTEDALDLLPKLQEDGSTIGPAAGRASYPDGWAAISEFYRRRNRDEAKPDWTLADGRTFSRHGREHTVRHELGHLLGLAHHEALANPGFAEAPGCETHNGAHHDCLMSCGSGDDDWFRIVKSGSGFGLCAKCEAAAKAFVAGLEASR